MFFVELSSLFSLCNRVIRITRAFRFMRFNTHGGEETQTHLEELSAAVTTGKRDVFHAVSCMPEFL